METFEKVYIKSVEDLPKEDGRFDVYFKNGEADNYGFVVGISEKSWLKEIDWYLRPISEVKEPAVTDEELSAILDSMNYETSKERENAWDLCMILRSRLQPAQITDKQIERWVHSKPGNSGNPLLDAAITVGAIEGAKAYRDGQIAEWIINQK